MKPRSTIQTQPAASHTQTDDTGISPEVLALLDEAETRQKPEAEPPAERRDGPDREPYGLD